MAGTQWVDTREELVRLAQLLQAKGATIGLTPEQLALAAQVLSDTAPCRCEGRSADHTALLESEQRYRSLFERNPDGVFAVDPEGRFIEANPACQVITGYTRDELLKMSFMQLCAPDQLARTVAHFRRHVSGNSEALHTALIRKDGRRVELLITGGPVIVDGQLRAVHCAAKDITERMQTAATLQESQERFRLLHETMLQGVVHQDAQGRIISVNPAAERILGKTLAELQGQTSVDRQDYCVREDGSPFPGEEHPAMVALRTGQSMRDVVMGVFNPRLQQHRWINISAVPLFRPGQAGACEVYALFDDITETRQAEGNQRLLAAQRQLALDAAHMGWWHYDPATRIARWDRRYQEIFGVTGSERPNEEILARIHPDDLPRVWAAVEAALDPRDPKPYSTEYRIFHDDGTLRWVEAHGVASFAGEPNDRRAVSFVGTVADITGRKQAERALHDLNLRLDAQSRRFDVVLSSIQDYVYIIDAEGRFIYANKRLLDLWGLSEAQAVGKTMRQLGYPTEVENALLQGVQTVFKTGTTVRNETHYPSPSGVSGYYENILSPLHGPGGQVELVAGSSREISERKRVEQRLAAEHAGLSLLHELSTRLLGQDDLPTLLRAVVSAALSLAGAERGTLQLYDASSSSLRLAASRGFEAAFLDYFNIVHDCPAVCGEAMRCGEQVVVEDVCQSPLFVGTTALSVLQAAGVQAVVSTPLRGRDGQLMGMVSTHWSKMHRPDAGTLQRLKLLAREAAHLVEDRRREQALRDANQAKDHFLAVLSHELRTPLTPVATAAQLLENQDSLSADQRELASMIRRNVELEARLIDDLLDLTRLSRGKLEMHFGTVDVHERIRHVLEMVGCDAGDKQLAMSFEAQAEHHHVQADAARLQQILWNLLKNAVKFTPVGGRITVRTHNPEPGTLAVVVQDTGVGIEPEVLPRIFDAFEQGGRSVTRQFGGLGLGLAISKGLTDLHGGTLKAHSPGRGLGATLTLGLPVSVRPQAQRPGTRTAADFQAGKADHRLLLVEDHRDTARMMARLLRSYGYEVVVADTVASALRAAEAYPFSLVVSDIGLPDGSGLDLMRQLQATYAITGIALSGFGMEEDIRRSMEAGFAAHLTKPVNLQKLHETIRQVLD